MNQLWYGKHVLAWILYPFSLVYRWVVWIRRWVLETFYQTAFDVPVIVVGNLTIGGVGKTPLVIAIAEHLGSHGFRVGIVSRGYGARIKHFPYHVQSDDVASEVGDEPLLLAQKTKVPVVIDPNRTQAVQFLLEKQTVDVVISDDGLQHYAMSRDIEIVVVDGKRGFGNGFCLPAGPMRESAKRIKKADFVVVNGGDWAGAYQMDLIPGDMYPKVLPPHASVAALAGIGHPERFFDTLTNLGIVHKPYRFPDHHQFVPENLEVAEDLVLMTEKDAVKCHTFSNKPMYVLPVKAYVRDNFWEKLDAHECLQK
ncbi:MAG: tetraacyldisaccharide 4'-kinase [Gammaproteobacteria bacterium]|nr:tetraacyldisaccharide 4'-kinase [Gammaproteobacteria bacterium]MCH9755882.1 tetraacyldisaccharide 4'-kinase [Gammaproteobacteria bacterium]